MRGLQVQPKPVTDNRQRVALVVGNSSYTSSPLKNPANDARAMAVSLRRLGFVVDERINLNYLELNKSIEAFGKKLKSGGIGLFYYAGHGMQVQGNNYLIPVDAQIDDENEVRFKAVDAGLVLAKMEQARSDVNIVILDACRDNPFSRSFRSTSRGLASMDAPSGTFIAYATAPGKTAADGGGSNGLYTAELIKVLQTPSLTLEQVFKRTLKAVREKSGNKQTPWMASNLEGEFYFVPPAVVSDPRSSSLQSTLPPPQVAQQPTTFSNPLTDTFTGMEFVSVPAGCFTVNGGPVCVDAFSIGKFEVTQSQWKKVMGNNPSHFTECGDSCPVEEVSWHDVQQFIQKLSAHTGMNYRLPTEIEWVYACKAGGNHAYCGSNNVNAVAWYGAYGGSKKGTSRETTNPVGQKQANAWGVYDMSGNVWEWVHDWYGDSYPSSSKNPQGPSSGTQRVIRGGSWYSNLPYLHTSFRQYEAPESRLNFLGLRLVAPVK
ncbi:caspase family protein [Trichlorobacter thiogenes]|nr:caspase family protein [Trichlorobacter thiogenes]